MLVIFVLLIFAIMFVSAAGVCRLSAKLDERCRKEAPKDLVDASWQQKDFFVKNYKQVGRNVTTKRYKAELERMAEYLKVAEGVVTESYPGVIVDNGQPYTTYDVKIQDKVYNKVEIMGTNGMPVDTLKEGSLVFGFFYRGKNDAYKSIAFKTATKNEIVTK